MRSLLLPLLAFFSLTTPVSAQANCLDQIKFPERGRWSEYKGSYKDDPYTMRYAVIGSESHGGKNLQWVEMRVIGAKKDRNIILQVLVPSSLADLSKVQEVIFKPGDQPAMKVSGPMLDMLRGQLEKELLFAKVCNGVSLVGKETVKVPAGGFESLHYRSADSADSWVSPEVPFSVVKSTGKNYQVELAGQGTGAKSSITETPQDMGDMGAPSH
jgi:hypothetical protein